MAKRHSRDYQFDTMTLVEPDGSAERLRRAGFRKVRVDRQPGAFRFRACR